MLCRRLSQARGEVQDLGDLLEILIRGSDLRVVELIPNPLILIGHTTIGTTADVCAHVTPVMQQRLADRMDAILAG